MTRRVTDDLTMTIHGMDADNERVRADVFAAQLKALVDILLATDKAKNGKQAYHYMIEHMEIGSAVVSLKEKQMRRTQEPPVSPKEVVGKVTRDIQEGATSFKDFPVSILKKIDKLAHQAGKKYDHAEACFGGTNIVRLDDYFSECTKRAISIAERRDLQPTKYFEGRSLESFDGSLQEMDSRGKIHRGKIILTIDGSQLDCVFESDVLEDMKESYNRRAIIEGTAIYNGLSPRPKRVQIHSVKILDKPCDLTKWRGSLQKPAQKTEWGLK